MSEFKERALMRNEQMKKMLRELENKRDSVLDEIAGKKGQAELLEDVIKRCYELILDVNKEEQNNEVLEISNKKREEEQKLKEASEAVPLEVFKKIAKGIKTPKHRRK